MPTAIPSDPRTQDLIQENNQQGQQSRDTKVTKELMEMGVGMGLGMEFLSVAAGVTAKDKRLKEVKNQAAALKAKDLLTKFSKNNFFFKICIFVVSVRRPANFTPSL